MLLNTVMVVQDRLLLERCSFVVTWILETEFNLLFLKLVGCLFQSEHASLELLISCGKFLPLFCITARRGYVIRKCL